MIGNKWFCFETKIVVDNAPIFFLSNKYFDLIKKCAFVGDY